MREKTANEIEAESMARRLKLSLQFSCSFCPWQFEGPLSEGMIEARQHRALEHPNVKQRTARKRKQPGVALRVVRHPDLNADEIAEIDEERRRRAALHGVEISE